MIHHERWGSVVMQPSPDTSPTALEGWDAVLMDKDPALMLMWELFTDRKIYRHFIHVCIHTYILPAYISKAKDWSLESFRSYHITLTHQRCTLQLGSIPNRWDEASLASRAREAPGASPNTVGASPKNGGQLLESCDSEGEIVLDRSAISDVLRIYKAYTTSMHSCDDSMYQYL